MQTAWVDSFIDKFVPQASHGHVKPPKSEQAKLGRANVALFAKKKPEAWPMVKLGGLRYLHGLRLLAPSQLDEHGPYTPL